MRVLRLIVDDAPFSAAFLAVFAFASFEPDFAPFASDLAPVYISLAMVTGASVGSSIVRMQSGVEGQSIYRGSSIGRGSGYKEESIR